MRGLYRSHLVRAMVAASVMCMYAAALADPAHKTNRGSAQHFQTSDRCIACHNGMQTPSGDDLSIGIDWRASIMANSARDPYWQASVRREITDHPAAATAIEDGCSDCHMPMARTEAKLRGQPGAVFAHLPVDPTKPEDLEAQDGVSCSLCHQISPDKLGKPESFSGGFVIAQAETGVH